jgi:hypothetical protein
MDNVEDLVFTHDNLPSVGDDVRVRPEPSRSVTYGQGDPLPGTIIQGVQFNWATALEVVTSSENGIGDPDAGTIDLDAIAQTPELFMSEANYQSLIN